jgi:hypothetical protein
MPEHRGDGAGPGSDGRCGRDAVHAAHGVRGGGPAIVGRRRGEELFRRGNLSSDSVCGLALALPYEGRFPQAGLSRRVLRMGSSESGDGVSLVGDRWRRRLIDDRRRINDQRRGNWRGGSSGPATPAGTASATAARAEAVRAAVRAPPAAVGPAPHVGPSAGEAGTDPHAPATSACAPAGETVAAAGRGWGGARGHAHARRPQQRQERRRRRACQGRRPPPRRRGEGKWRGTEEAARQPWEGRWRAGARGSSAGWRRVLAHRGSWRLLPGAQGLVPATALGPGGGGLARRGRARRRRWGRAGADPGGGGWRNPAAAWRGFLGGVRARPGAQGSWRRRPGAQGQGPAAALGARRGRSRRRRLEKP